MSDTLQIHPELASTFAFWVDAIYFALVAGSVFFAGITVVAVGYFCVKYRRRSPDERPEKGHEIHSAEIILTVVLCLLVVPTFTAGAAYYFHMYRAPSDPIEVYAVGKQWMWKIQHPSGKREINTLHVPINQPVRITLASEDVIHSFYIPAFRTKKDAVPGRYTTMWFEATKLGEFHLFCAEYCGTQHSTMIGKVIVMEQEDYQNWLGGGASGETMAEAGERQFGELGCQTCHKTTSDGRGPTLIGVYDHSVTLTNGVEVLADDDYIRESILNPAAKVVHGYAPIMPTFEGQISEETLLQLIAYIKSLATAAE